MESEIIKYPFRIQGSNRRFPFASVVVVDNIAYVSGMTAIPLNADEELTVTIENQMWVALTSMKLALEEAGSCLNNVFKTLILLKDIRDFMDMRATERKFYHEYAPELIEYPPASTMFQAAMSNPKFIVEIECMAVVNRRSYSGEG